MDGPRIRHPALYLPNVLLCLLLPLAGAQESELPTTRVIRATLAPHVSTNALAAAGVEVARPVGGPDWVLRVPDAERWRGILQQGLLAAAADLSAVDCLAATVTDALAEGVAPAFAVAADGWWRLSVQLLAPDRDEAALRGAVAAAGGRCPEASARYSGLLLVEIPVVRLRALAELPQVLRIELADAPRILFNRQAQQLHQVDVIQAGAYSLSGSGVNLGVWDGGPAASHGDFSGRRTNVEGGASDDHATHVTGTMIGNGAGNPSAEGMAPAARTYNYDFNGDVAQEMNSAVSSYGIVACNNSWGLGIGWYDDGFGWQMGAPQSLFGDYTASESASIDTMVAANPTLLPVWACGNDRWEGPAGSEDGTLAPDGERYDCIGPFGVAKNILSVGALSDNGQMMTGFSGFGPADDGRIKPDLVANGEQVLSTVPGGGYDSWDGTSMAAPVITGSLGTLTQAYKNGSGGAAPGNATLKAIVLNTCDDLHTTGPDARTGYGKLNARAAADLIGSHFTAGVDRVLTGSVGSGQTFERAFTVPAGLTNLRITVAWVDPAGSGGAAQALVNDLDLVLVQTGTGAQHQPWRISAGSPHLSATRGVNRTDNVEQVMVVSPAAGGWLLRVSGFSVSGGQAFSLASSVDLAGGGGGGPALHTLGGMISSGATPVAGVTVSLSGAATAQTTTNGAGNYSFQVADGSYMVTPTSASYTFNPTQRAVLIAGAMSPANDFAATPVGPPPPGGVCTYLRDEAPDRAIPDDDPGGIVSSLVVGDAFTITDLQVRVEIRHTYRGDLRIELVAPGGSPSALLKEIDGGDSAGDVRGTFDTTLTPVDPLSVFNGTGSMGTWQLLVSDNYQVDTGFLEEWELILDCPGAGAPLAITTTTLPVATQGLPYAQALQATGGTAPHTWSLAAGSLPAGVTLSPGGTLGGTPVVSGGFAFTARVQDAVGGNDTQALSLTVIAGGPPPGGHTGICGDCTDNGAVDILDSLLAAAVSVGVSALPGTDGQCNVVGGAASPIDILDSLAIARHAAGLLPILTCTP